MKPTRKQEKAERARIVRAHRDFVYGKVLDRDADKYGAVRCVKCGRPYEEIHEIVPKGRARGFEQVRYFIPENCCALCIPCHSVSHTKKGRAELCRIMYEKYGYKYQSNGYAWVFFTKKIDELLAWSGVKSELLDFL